MNKQTLIDKLTEFLMDDQLESQFEAANVATRFAASLEPFLDDADTINIKWSIEDVQSVRPDLSDQQAREVLATADRRHDANEGINWSVLECHADMMFDRPANFDEIFEAAND